MANKILILLFWCWLVDVPPAPTILTATLFAQNIQVPLSTGPPPPVTTVTAQALSTGGTQQRWYWAVARYPVGNAAPGGPFSLTGITYPPGASVNWSSVPGATGYDILATTSAAFPASGTCVCLVASNVAAGPVTDTGTYTAYTAVTAGPATATVSINNRDFSTPEIIVPSYTMSVQSVTFPDGTSFSSAKGLTGPLTLPEIATPAAPGIGFETLFPSSSQLRYQGINSNNAISGTVPEDGIGNFTGTSFTATGALVAGSNSNAPGLITMNDSNNANPVTISAQTTGSGLSLAGTAPASVASGNGTNAQPFFTVAGPAGGPVSLGSGTAGNGANENLTCGAGGNGTGGTANGGDGGACGFSSGTGGTSTGGTAGHNGTAFVSWGTGNNVVVCTTSGQCKLVQPSLKGSTYTTGKLGVYTANQLVASNPIPSQMAAISDCSSLATCTSFVGVNAAANGTMAEEVVSGTTPVLSASAQQFSFNDFVCPDPANNGNVIDTGSTACSWGLSGVGLAAGDFGAGSASHTVNIRPVPPQALRFFVASGGFTTTQTSKDGAGTGITGLTGIAIPASVNGFIECQLIYQVSATTLAPNWDWVTSAAGNPTASTFTLSQTTTRGAAAAVYDDATSTWNASLGGTATNASATNYRASLYLTIYNSSNGNGNLSLHVNASSAGTVTVVGGTCLAQ